MTTDDYTLRKIRNERRRLRAALEENKERIADRCDQLLNPSPARSRMELWVNRAESAFAIYDGVMTGYKLLRTVRRVLPRKKKK